MATEQVESPALRLARYLRQFVGLRTTPTRDLSKYETVLWFHSLPQVADCLSAAWAASDGVSPWLEVHKQRFSPPPEPPEVLRGWLDSGALKVARQDLPPLPRFIFQDDPSAVVDEGEMWPQVPVYIETRPDVSAAFVKYRDLWMAWAEDRRRREAIQKVYAELFSLHTQLQKQGELVELVLGVGLLDWRATLNGKSVPVRRHVVVLDAELEFEPERGVLRVLPPGQGARPRLEDDMLEPELRPDRAEYAVVERQLQEIGDDVWERASIDAALKTWAQAVSPDLRWHSGLEIDAAHPSGQALSFAPALILRRRGQAGMARIYDELIRQLAAGGEVPDGWASLIADLDDRPGGGGDGFGEFAGATPVTVPAGDTYFPLPANREQKRIVDALEGRRGVLVQGPPGTGKSHTIANLICHLLATGKRVLITAETARALQVLKGKLPKEIQPLCVSLLGQGGDAFAELNAAVTGITTRQASYSPGCHDERIAEIDRELDAVRRAGASFDTELRSLREDETYPHSLADGRYSGTASEIARRVSEERVRFSWLKLPEEATERPSIDAPALAAWLGNLRSYSAEEVAEAGLETPRSQDIASPAQFIAAVNAAAAADEDAAAVSQRRAHAAFTAIAGLPAEQRKQLAETLSGLDRQRAALDRLSAEWPLAVIRDALGGTTARWDALEKRSHLLALKLKASLQRTQERSIRIPDDHALEKVRSDAQAASTFLDSGGKWKRFGLVTPRELKGLQYLRRELSVDGQSPESPDRLRLVVEEINARLAVAELRRLWADVTDAETSIDSATCARVIDERLGWLRDSLAYADSCQKTGVAMLMGKPSVPEPDWLSGDAREWVALIDASFVVDKQRSATDAVSAFDSALASVAELHNVHPVVANLRAAIRGRDVSSYSAAHAKVVEIERVRAAIEHRRRVEGLLNQSAPGIVGAVTQTLMDAAWDDRFSQWAGAWAWAVADQWLEKRSKPGYHQRLSHRRQDLADKEAELIAESAALRAWTHFFSRLSLKEAAALRGWRETVKAMGKGTGRSMKLARLQRAARQYMDECRDAIPIWVMPRYLVADMLTPGPAQYDLVIVDEASQLGIDSLFLFYIAKKLVVVGDDQQISPYGIGIPDEALSGLQRQYLDGISHVPALSAQSSLYANAKIRFSQNVVLREHFRCMPEIIQFSNDLCYASNGTPLDPLRAYPPDRLEPLMLRHVADGYRTGGATAAQNVPEADAVVAQILACVADPRYKHASMGVISLQGETQAKLIETKLQAALEEKEIAARRLICGDAYAFQGDERTVMFLSMVAAPGETRIGALANESAKQRFNVAVSRAQDQLWLFHSATLDVLSDQCMRHRLLSYMLDPGRQTVSEVTQKFDSDFEREVFRRISERGFHVRTQVCVGDPTNHRYRIDLVVEGMKGSLAVECDGDQWHGPERYEHDMARQRDLERAGWRFVRVRGGEFYRDPERAMVPLWTELERLGIWPRGVMGPNVESPTSNTPRVEVDDAVRREALVIDDSDTPHVDAEIDDDREIPEAEPAAATVSAKSTGRDGLQPYTSMEGECGPHPHIASAQEVADGLVKIVRVEGPMLARRAYDIYLRACGVKRMGGELKSALNKALQRAINQGAIEKEDERSKGGLLYSIVRVAGTPHVVVRLRGPRDLEEIPPSELQYVAKWIARSRDYESGSVPHLRAILEQFDLKRLTDQTTAILRDAIERDLPYVDAMFREAED